MTEGTISDVGHKGPAYIRPRCINQSNMLAETLVETRYEECGVCLVKNNTWPEIFCVALSEVWSQFRWPCRLRRMFAASGRLRSRVRITLAAWIFVVCVFMSFVKVEASATSWSFVQRSCAACVCLNVCELGTSTTRRSRTKLGCFTAENNLID
jgi:hypothetical protein